MNGMHAMEHVCSGRALQSDNVNDKFNVTAAVIIPSLKNFLLPPEAETLFKYSVVLSYLCGE